MTTNYLKQDILAMQQRYRAHFINSLSGYKSANLVGTIDNNNQSNLSIVSSVFHLGADPALMGMIIRPHSTPRHTLENIIETQQYTINQVSSTIYKNAHQTSARYDKTESEYDQVGLATEFHDNITAPFVKESRLKMALRLEEYQTLELNQCVMVIGSIEQVIIEPNAINQDGSIDLEKLDAVAISGLDTYSRGVKLAKLSYAKPNEPIIEL